MRQPEGPRPTDMPVYAAMVRLVDWRSRQPAWHSYTDTSIQSPAPFASARRSAIRVATAATMPAW